MSLDLDNAISVTFPAAIRRIPRYECSHRKPHQCELGRDVTKISTPGEATRRSLAAAGHAPGGGFVPRLRGEYRRNVSVSVIDTAKNKVVQEIGGIQVPEGVAVSPDGKRLYITQFPEKILTVVDRKTGKKIKEVPVSGHSNDIAVTKDGRWVLVCNAETPGGLDIVDAATLELVKSIPTKTKVHDIVLTGDNKYAIGTSEGAGMLYVFDLQSQTIAWDHKFDMGTNVTAVESNPDGSANRLFLQMNRLRGFKVIDFATRRGSAIDITFPDDQPTVDSQRVSCPRHRRSA